jgi:arsenate reductase (glutaredoxin)
VSSGALSGPGRDHLERPLFRLLPQGYPYEISRGLMRIYHNPACGTSRTVLGMIKDAGHRPEIIEYLKTPPDRAELTDLLAKLGLKARDILRSKGTTLETLGLDGAKMTDKQILDAILEHPILMERPIVVKGKKAAICRPADKVTPFL